MDEKKINGEMTQEQKTISESAEEERPIQGEQPARGEQTGGGERAAEAEQEAPKKKRSPIRIAIALGLLAYAVFILARQYIFIPGEYEAPPTEPPAAESAADSTPEPTPYIQKIPVKMYFTEREISFPVEKVGLVPYTDAKGNEMTNEQGQPIYTMGTIDSEKVAAWLEGGPSPGEYGNALFNGHVSWKKVAGVFSVLPKMEIGEEIVVEYDDGSTMSFLVTSNDIYNIDSVPDEVMAFYTEDARMTLITCYGESWNSGIGTRNERCVVVAKPANPDEIIFPNYEDSDSG